MAIKESSENEETEENSKIITEAGPAAGPADWLQDTAGQEE
jgi:hypothetical protein